MWYEQPAASYALYLRFCAERSDAQVARHRAEAKPWGAYEINRAERQARRLRAQARLCELAGDVLAGDVDFLGMSDPSQSREAEDAAVAKAFGSE